MSSDITLTNKFYIHKVYFDSENETFFYIDIEMIRIVKALFQAYRYLIKWKYIISNVLQRNGSHPFTPSNMEMRSNTFDSTQMILFLYNKNMFEKDTQSRGTIYFYS